MKSSIVQELVRFKTHRIVLILAIALLLLTACGGQPVQSVQQQQHTPTPSAPTQTPTTATSQNVPYAGTDAVQIVQKLKARGLPIGPWYSYTAGSDIDGLLGKPGEYISKVAFFDTRLTGAGTIDPNTSVENGGIIEVFADPTDAQNRYSFLKTRSSNNPEVYGEYDYVQGDAVLRISGQLQPGMAQDYNAAFIAG